MTRRLPVKTALLGLLVAPSAMAQQSPATSAGAARRPIPAAQPADPNAAPATLAPVTVTGTRPSDDFVKPNSSLDRIGDLRDTPQSVTIITKALMQSQGSTSLTSAVSHVPGVTIGAAEGSQIGTNINLNGFSARTDLYIDGMRDAAQYYRDTFALEEIEVLMGPSSMLFGRGSTGGVINQVFKKPTLTKKEEYSVSGTTNGLFRGTADINLPTSDTSAFRVAAMFQEGAASTRNQTNVLDVGLAPSYKFGIGTPTDVTLYALLQLNHDQADYGVPPVNFFPAQVNRNNAYGFSDDRTDQDVMFVGARVNHKFDENLSVRNQTQLNYVNTNARETAPQSVGTVGPGRLRPDRRRPDRPADELAVRSPAEPRPQHLPVVALQPDRAQRQVRHRPDQPRRHQRRGAGIRELLQPELRQERHLQRRGARPGQLHERLRRLHVARQSGGRQHALQRGIDPDQSRDGAGQGLCGIRQRHDHDHPRGQVRRPACATTSTGRRSATRSTCRTRRATRCWVMPSRPTPSPACAAARSSSPTRCRPTTSRTAPRSIPRSSSS